MRTVGFDKDKFDKIKENSTDILEALVIRELQNLASEPVLNGKQIIALERLGNLLLKKKSSDREETLLLHKLNNGKALEITQDDIAGLIESLKGGSDGG